MVNVLASSVHKKPIATLEGKLLIQAVMESHLSNVVIYCLVALFISILLIYVFGFLRVQFWHLFMMIFELLFLVIVLYPMRSGITKQLYDLMFQTAYEDFEKYNMSALTKTIEVVAKEMTTFIGQLVMFCFMIPYIAILFGLLLWKKPWSIIFLTISIAMFIIVLKNTTKSLRKQQNDITAIGDKLNGILTPAMQHRKTLMAQKMEQPVLQYVHTLSRELQEVKHDHEIKKQLYWCVLLISFSFPLLCMIILMDLNNLKSTIFGTEVNSSGNSPFQPLIEIRQLKYDQIVRIILVYSSVVFAVILQIYSSVIFLRETLGKMRITTNNNQFGLLNLQEPIQSVTIRNLTYIRKGKKILDNFSMEFTPGIFCFVGKSGIGKSTLFDIISGLITEYEGEVLINGIDIKNYNIDFLRDHINYLTQQSILFDITTRQQLELTGIKFNDETMHDLLRKVNLEFLIYEPGRTLGDNGSRLSGGQKQRLCIARSLLKPKFLYLLDEITSSLDIKNAHDVFNILLEVFKQNMPIVILIEHRPEILPLCKEVVYFQNNGQYSRGTHEYLMANNPEYQEHWILPRKHYDISKDEKATG